MYVSTVKKNQRIYYKNIYLYDITFLLVSLTIILMTQKCFQVIQSTFAYDN